MVSGSDGNLWFTEFYGNQVDRITPAGVVTAFTEGIAPGSNPGAIASGEDGNLWFVEVLTKRIARITTSGVVTEFAGLGSGCDPSDITAGPEGDIWFTESGCEHIGRITPSGTITEFTVASGAEPVGITTGPDGNLWFTESNDGIGRMTPTGEETEFATGSGNVPGFITVGPDGDLWFTQRNDEVGRMTTSGQVTEFTQGITSQSNPGGIVSGPEGDLWFTEYLGNRLARITPSGVVTQYSGIKGKSKPGVVVVGPEGALWFNEFAGGRIGRAIVTPTTTQPEFGQCEATKPGKYTSAACIKTGSSGSFEWSLGAATAGADGVSFSAPAMAFEGAGGATVTCTGASGEGEYSDFRTITEVEIAFTGCGIRGEPCTSLGAVGGEIVTGELDASLVWERRLSKKVSLELHSATGASFTEFVCGATAYAVRGAVLVSVKSDKMLATQTLKYSATGGVEKLSEYEEPNGTRVPATLEASVGGGSYEEAALVGRMTLMSEESIEINGVL